MTIPLLLALVIAAPSLVDGVVAQVDGEPVLASELAPMVARGLSRTQAVEELIRQRLLDVEAKRRGLSVSDDALKATLEEVCRRNKLPNLAALRQAVNGSGRSFDAYREQIRDQLLQRQVLGAVMRGGTQVTERELDEAIARDPSLIETRSVRHILLQLDKSAEDWAVKDAKSRLLGWRTELLNGADFSAYAKTHSEGPSASQGGSIGSIGKGETDPAFEAVAFAAQKGEIAGPVRSSFGWHLILVDEIEAAPKSAKARDNLRRSLRQKNAEQALKLALTKAREGALVRIFPVRSP
jgi:peptidyl-prolyl cis-trans isomerase C